MHKGESPIGQLLSYTNSQDAELDYMLSDQFNTLQVLLSASSEAMVDVCVLPD